MERGRLDGRRAGEGTHADIREDGGGRAHVGWRAPCRVGVGVGLPCWHAGGLGAKAHSSTGCQFARWCPHFTLPRNPPLCGGIATGSAECGGVCFTDATGIVLLGENARGRRSYEAQRRRQARGSTASR